MPLLLDLRLAEGKAEGADEKRWQVGNPQGGPISPHSGTVRGPLKGRGYETECETFQLAAGRQGQMQ